jgi:hypothetical protein
MRMRVMLPVIASNPVARHDSSPLDSRRALLHQRDRQGCATLLS